MNKFFKIFVSIPIIFVGIFVAVSSIQTLKMSDQFRLKNAIDKRFINLEEIFEYNLMRNLRSISSIFSLHSSSLPMIEIKIPSANLKKLNSDMPYSGLEYTSAWLNYGGNFKKIKYRYRGDSPLHYVYDKKSFRVKTKKNHPFMGMRKFNVIIPKYDLSLNNYAGYQMSKYFDLLSPHSEFVQSSINGSRGIFLLVEQIDETWLRKNNRMPGDIYQGESIAKDRFTPDADSLFDDAAYWNKIAINNHYEPNSKAPLKILLEIINDGSTQSLKELEKLIDIDEWARFAAFCNVIQTFHFDEVHNWKLYYDPWKGKFYPIVWDPLPFARKIINKAHRANRFDEIYVSKNSRLMKKLYEIPGFNERQEKHFSNFFSKHSSTFIKDIKNMANILKEDFRMDYLDIYSYSERKAGIDRFIDYVDKRFEGVKDNLKKSQHKTKYPEKTKISKSLTGEIIFNENTSFDDDVYIAPGSVLRIGKGVNLVFNARVVIDGTDVSPVKIMPIEEGSPWGSILLIGKNANNSVIKNAIFKGGSGYKDKLSEVSGMFSIHNVENFQIKNSTFSDNELVDDMVHIVYSTGIIDNVEFHRAKSDALDIDISKVKISNSNFFDSGNDAIDLMTSIGEITNVSIFNSGDKGISVGERSVVELYNSQINNSVIGVQSKDKSKIQIYNSQFTGNKLALSAYKKNWQYFGGGEIEIENVSFENNKSISKIDKYSKLLHLDNSLSSSAGLR